MKKVFGYGHLVYAYRLPCLSLIMVWQPIYLFKHIIVSILMLTSYAEVLHNQELEVDTKKYEDDECEDDESSSDTNTDDSDESESYSSMGSDCQTEISYPSRSEDMNFRFDRMIKERIDDLEGQKNAKLEQAMENLSEKITKIISEKGMAENGYVQNLLQKIDDLENNINQEEENKKHLEEKIENQNGYIESLLKENAELRIIAEERRTWTRTTLH